MPVRQKDADGNIVSIKTLNDITPGSPLSVSIPGGVITSVDTATQTRIGGTGSAPAASTATDTGLNGVIKGLWKDLGDRFLSLVGTQADPASATGSLMARLRAIAEGGGGAGGTTDVSGVETRLGATNEAAATTDTATSGLNGLVKRLLGRFTTLIDSVGVTSEVAAATDSTASGLNGLLKRLLTRFTTYLTAFGTTADVADTTGTLMARSRASLDRVGSHGDAATPTGSVMAQLRYVGESLNRTSIITPINESLAGDRVIIAATAGKAIRISSLYYTVDSSVNITLKSGVTTISGAMPILDHAGDYPQPLPLGVGEALVINLSAAANLRGYVIWYLV